ncbi:unnamed protein product [Vitrella brassicaformis CCMP3155]|uniref:DUF4604 domain-containing protein n=1 Tax=Vitrella brassicaformis (strain CCMP3155) TaxID=1169540 RepID=A0A0G4FV99_VITBC|nr:unnamed protein product [Vitrella brassicaformis CCMP3155]|eukprot:CEM18523.1 unnamed protein product [Vitrella brassicaformis CCMP3155]
MEGFDQKRYRGGGTAGGGKKGGYGGLTYVKQVPKFLQKYYDQHPELAVSEKHQKTVSQRTPNESREEEMAHMLKDLESAQIVDSSVTLDDLKKQHALQSHKDARAHQTCDVKSLEAEGKFVFKKPTAASSRPDKDHHPSARRGRAERDHPSSRGGRSEEPSRHRGRSRSRSRSRERFRETSRERDDRRWREDSERERGRGDDDRGRSGRGRVDKDRASEAKEGRKGAAKNLLSFDDD